MRHAYKSITCLTCVDKETLETCSVGVDIPFGIRVPFERISSIHASAMSAYVSLTSHAARLSPQTDVFSNKESLRATDLAFHRTERRVYAVRLLNFN